MDDVDVGVLRDELVGLVEESEQYHRRVVERGNRLQNALPFCVFAALLGVVLVTGWLSPLWAAASWLWHSTHSVVLWFLTWVFSYLITAYPLIMLFSVVGLFIVAICGVAGWALTALIYRHDHKEPLQAYRRVQAALEDGQPSWKAWAGELRSLGLSTVPRRRRQKVERVVTVLDELATLQGRADTSADGNDQLNPDAGGAATGTDVEPAG